MGHLEVADNWFLRFYVLGHAPFGPRLGHFKLTVGS